jgi:hypothetical protein
MSELNIETFRASTMIMGTFGLYLAISTRDHEKDPIRGLLTLGDNPLSVRCRMTYALLAAAAGGAAGQEGGV